MQINKKGEIINAPQYKINGKERKKLKARVSKLKSAIKMFWYWEDLHRVYGTAYLSHDECIEVLNNMKHEIEELDVQLKQPFMPNIDPNVQVSDTTDAE